jgi:hypothetical protein
MVGLEIPGKRRGLAEDGNGHLFTVNLRRRYQVLAESVNQCCGSVTFWYGSGSADPCLWLMDPDPAIFVIDLQEAFKNYFLLITFWRYIYIIFQILKCRREVTKNSRNQRFFLTFLLDDKGSGSGSVPLTNGIRIRIRTQNSTNKDFSSYFCFIIEGSGRPKNIWIGSGSGFAALVCDRSGSTVTKFLLTRKGESEDSIEVLILVLDPVTDTVLKECNSAYMPQPDT